VTLRQLIVPHLSIIANVPIQSTELQQAASSGGILSDCQAVVVVWELWVVIVDVLYMHC
jgi:hypothetical protein